jgi:hypothetical protein
MSWNVYTYDLPRMQMLETKVVLHCPFSEVAERTLFLDDKQDSEQKRKKQKTERNKPIWITTLVQCNISHKN